MGQQQLLLIILGIIIIGIIIGIGLWMSKIQSLQAERENMIASLNDLANHARAYYSTPVQSAGGGDSYTGYRIPTRMQNNGVASFSATSTSTRVFFTATSVRNSESMIRVTLGDSNTPLFDWTFLGEFEE